MPEITIQLSAAEDADLRSVAEARLQTPEDAGHDLLVSAVADEMKKSPDARDRSHNRGVMAARRQTVFSDAFVRTSTQLNGSGHSRGRRNF